jgi:multisubunit Na+/H+ antiporter MnhE subunit
MHTQDRSQSRGEIVVLEIAAWWALMVGVWDLTLAGTTLPDILAAIGAGFVSAVGAHVARRLIGGNWAPSPRWLLWLPVIVVNAVADTARAFTLAARHVVRRDVDATFGDVPLRRRSDRDADIHRGLATLAITSTPGSVIYDEDIEGSRLFKHELVSGPPDLEGVVGK